MKKRTEVKILSHFKTVTPRLSGLAILISATLIFKNLLISKNDFF